ncbi:hypothetical protein [Kribbella sp. CA-294648]|uniref:hypothetical protein n=1 Tax=Kribbella sp. CA-294648 TaxID=3239948 RepID=UPI003D93E8CD
MRKFVATIGSIAVVAMLASCSGEEPPSNGPGDTAACKAAMKADYGKALATPGGPTASRPTACNGIDDATAQRLAGEVMSEVTPAPPTPTPTSTPTPKVLTIAQAGKVYLAAVEPRNVTSEKFAKDYDAGASAKALRADAVKGLKTERHFLEVLDRTLWPEVVAANVANLIDCQGQLVSWFSANTRITKRSQITGAPDCGTGDAQIVRARLGLPPA